MGDIIGRGSYGTVRACVSMEDGRPYAAKVLCKSILKRKRVGQFGNALQSVQREVAIWKKLAHPNVVRLIEVIDDPDHDRLFLISEYVPGGCLLPDERKCTPLHPRAARRFFTQLMEGLEYLHAQRVIHRDIKPGNLLVSLPAIGSAAAAAMAKAAAAAAASAAALAASSSANHARGSSGASVDHARGSSGASVDHARGSSGASVDHARGSSGASAAGSAAGEGGGRLAGQSTEAGASPPISTNDPSAAPEDDEGTLMPGRRSYPAAAELKVADFGVAQMWEGDDDKIRSTAGTAAFMAPEMMDGSYFSGRAVDVWAAGISLFMMLVGRPPFWARTVAMLYDMIAEDELTIPEGSAADTPLVRDLLGRMLQKDPKKRLTVQQVLQHEYCAELLEWEEVEVEAVPAGGSSASGGQPETDTAAVPARRMRRRRSRVALRRIEPTAEDVRRAITRMVTLSGIVRAKRASRQLLRVARERKRRREVEAKRAAMLARHRARKAAAAAPPAMARASIVGPTDQPAAQAATAAAAQA